MKNGLKIKNIIFFVFAFFIWFTIKANAQILFFEPDEITLNVGESLPVSIFLNTEENIVNVLSLKFKYDPAKIEISQVNLGGSVFSIVPVQPDISSSQKIGSFFGAKPNGFKSEKALVGHLLIKTVAKGTSEIVILPDSQVYLNDGLGTEVPLKVLANLKIKSILKNSKSLAVYSTTHPDSSKWYNLTKASIFWSVDKDKRYSYEISSDYFKEPDDEPDTPIGFLTLKNLPAGISYFHLKECTLQGDCDVRTSFRFQIDPTPPKSSIVRFQIEGQDFVSIIANDQNSGIDKIEKFIFIKSSQEDKKMGVLGNGTWQKVQMPYPISSKDQETLIFKVTDKAGNEEIIKVSTAQKNYFMIGLIVSLMIILLFYIIVKIVRNKIKLPFGKNSLDDIIKAMGKKISSIVLIIFLMFFACFAYAQVQEIKEDNLHQTSNWRIFFDGKLANVDGSLVADGKYNARFAIYDKPTDGDKVWEEIFDNDLKVEVKNGNFQVMLGSNNPIDLDFDQKDYFLAVSIGGTALVPIWDQEMRPRKKIITLEKLLNSDSQITLSQGELIDALIKEFELLNEKTKAKKSAAAFIEFIKNKLQTSEESIIIVNLDTLQEIIEKAVKINQTDKDITAQINGNILDFIVRIIDILIEKISQFLEKIGQIFSYLINISDKVDKIYDIVSNQQSSVEEVSQSFKDSLKIEAPTQIFGTAKIKPSENIVFVDVPQIESASKIFITFEKTPPFIWWISQKTQGKGFTLSLYPEAVEEIHFDWWVLNNLHFKEPVLPSPVILPLNVEQTIMPQSLPQDVTPQSTDENFNISRTEQLLPDNNATQEQPIQ